MTRLDRRVLFSRTTPLGVFALHPLVPDEDGEFLHAWVTHPKATYWMMGDLNPGEVRRAYEEIAAHPHHDAFVGTLDGEPCFLMERYDPAKVELAGLYEDRPGDIGMHFLCAPAGEPVHGFTRAVITTVVSSLFEDPGVRRVVVEPDVRNTAVHALNTAVGFVPETTLTKPEKEALLSFCTRERFRAATEGVNE
ncbi:GNAT family N-acetyltransferase [Streptomyces sp. WZ.A104]|uniref:GNAT family N-acetyltransferase n=1 Tax=Streptomyces sp. WZ.A104 TaxID=2023771 RepID=UPI000BBBFEA9|nr:GNAT family N-acetyltransferase [Streptomyces sp. WZ.A104]PCG84200.1 GNAT family N-acetyltransferase [Streptomyces sp. WZ.A104]